MKLQNGDIIWRQMLGNPLFRHYGIVIDNTTGAELIAQHSSCGGGGASIISLKMFLEKRELQGSEKTVLSGSSTQEMLAHFGNKANDDFNILMNNCEKWAHSMARNGTGMKEPRKAILYVLAVVVLLKAIKIL
jgi:hypothetical protein